MAEAPELVATLDRGLRELRIDRGAEAQERLATLALELERWGSRINLTGHRDAETIVRRLVLDAAALLAALPPFESLADLGSGAGFPGLPMAVLEPERHFVLVEARERRHFFQRQMIRQLGLGNVEAVLGRFDELEPRRCQAAVAQAVASPEALSAALERWCLPGGFVVVPGGETPRDGASTSTHAGRNLEYRVPLGGPARTLWLSDVSGAV